MSQTNAKKMPPFIYNPHQMYQMSGGAVWDYADYGMLVLMVMPNIHYC